MFVNSDVFAKDDRSPLNEFKRDEFIKEKFALEFQHENKVNQNFVRDRQVVIQLKDSNGFNRKKYPITLEFKKKNRLIVRVNDSYKVEEVLDQLNQNSSIKYAEPNYQRFFQYVPNDPLFLEQAYLNLIDMPKAWDISTGTPDVVIAVLDSGFNSHEDMQKNILPGYNVALNNSNVTDNIGHGTRVTGIIAAESNNYGITGMAFNTKILPIKISNEKDEILDSAIVDGIDYAIQQGVDVINMSFAGPENSDQINEAIERAHYHGIVLVAAGGNNRTNTEYYPAAHPLVIGVSATDLQDEKANFSNYGNWIDISAPGQNILTTTNQYGSYVEGAGTSFSAPMVSALAALIKSIHPDWTPAWIEYAIEKGADKQEEWNQELGYGRINAYQSLSLDSSKAIENDIPSSYEEAILLENHVGQSERMNLPMDADAFKINIPYAGELSVSVNNVNQNLDLVGVLSEENYGVIKNIQMVDNKSLGGNEQLKLKVEAGTYYFTVYDYNNNWSESSYSIKSSFTKEPSVRISGQDRYETAVKISQEGWYGGSDTVIIATGTSFPDALAGAPLAYALDAPILLTRPSNLPQSTKDEIIRLQPEQAILLGGTAAISQEVKDELTQMGVKMERISGENRFETAVAIADKLSEIQGSQSKKAIITNGMNFPDALTVGVYAAKEGIPILLTRRDSLPEVTSDALVQRSETVIVGGTGAVSDSVMSSLPTPARISGKDRFETNVEIISKLNQPKDRILVATGYQFADALSGSVLAAKTNRSIVLVKQDQIPAVTKSLFYGISSLDFQIVGGSAAVGMEVQSELESNN